MTRAATDPVWYGCVLSSHGESWTKYNLTEPIPLQHHSSEQQYWSPTFFADRLQLSQLATKLLIQFSTHQSCNIGHQPSLPTISSFLVKPLPAIVRSKSPHRFWPLLAHILHAIVRSKFPYTLCRLKLVHILCAIVTSKSSDCLWSLASSLTACIFFFQLEISLLPLSSCLVHCCPFLIVRYVLRSLTNFQANAFK